MYPCGMGYSGYFFIALPPDAVKMLAYLFIQLFMQGTAIYMTGHSISFGSM